jgi:hypothetical protein
MLMSLVKIICTCSDPTYSVPVDSLKWGKEKITGEFPLGEVKADG